MRKIIAMVAAVSLTLSAGTMAQAACPSPCVRGVMQHCISWRGNERDGVYGHHGNGYDCILRDVNVGAICDNWRRSSYGSAAEQGQAWETQTADVQTATGQLVGSQDTDQAQTAGCPGGSYGTVYSGGHHADRHHGSGHHGRHH